MSYAIEADKISKTFLPVKGPLKLFAHSAVTEPKTALHEVSFNVKYGELFGFLGPNGAGKTTLIKILCTIVLPTSGVARICGYDSVSESLKVQNKIGLVTTEERSFYWRLTGRQNLQFFSALYKIPKSVAAKRIDSLLEMLDLSRDGDKMFQTYSTGMKQKMCVARGLLPDPEIIFMDEPTRSIDPIAAGDIKRFIREELTNKMKKTVFLTTHRLEEAQELCDRIAILHKGVINACGTLEELRDMLRVPRKYTIEVSDLDSSVVSSLQSVKGVDMFKVENGDEAKLITFQSQNGKETFSEVLERIRQGNGRILECHTEKASLEEMFSRIVKDGQGFCEEQKVEVA